jgi:hypothetical protein
MTARDPFGKQRFCRGCGCTETCACHVNTDRGTIGCWWIVLDLDGPTGFCSACAIEQGWDQESIAALALYEAPAGGKRLAQGRGLVLP